MPYLERWCSLEGLSIDTDIQPLNRLLPIDSALLDFTLLEIFRFWAALKWEEGSVNIKTEDSGSDWCIYAGIRSKNNPYRPEDSKNLELLRDHFFGSLIVMERFNGEMTVSHEDNTLNFKVSLPFDDLKE